MVNIVGEPVWFVRGAPEQGPAHPAVRHQEEPHRLPGPERQDVVHLWRNTPPRDTMDKKRRSTAPGSDKLRQLWQNFSDRTR